MDPLAKSLLERLLNSGERHEAGARQRAPCLTARDLAEYRALKVLSRKEALEGAFKAARAQGCVELEWDEGSERRDRFVNRITLLDPAGLARMLGRQPAKERRAQARELLEPYLPDFPAIADVLARWDAMKTVRSLKPEDAEIWRDAATVILKAREIECGREDYRPLRVVSAQIFRDSKRIEHVTPAIDVLLAGSVQAPPRDPWEVWRELGLAKEDHPVRMAGAVVVVRERVTALLDTPYGAFPASTTMGVDHATPPAQVITVENLTTFHEEAKRGCEKPELLVYTGGTPSPAWRAMYERVLRTIPAGVPVLHWGDVDEGGFRIAAQIARVVAVAGHELRPRLMRPSEVPEEKRRPAARQTLERMRRFAIEAGWKEIASEIDVEHGFTVEQEALDS